MGPNEQFSCALVESVVIKKTLLRSFLWSTGRSCNEHANGHRVTISEDLLLLKSYAGTIYCCQKLMHSVGAL